MEKAKAKAKAGVRIKEKVGDRTKLGVVEKAKIGIKLTVAAGGAAWNGKTKK